MSPNLTRLTVKFTRVNLFPSRDQFAMDPSPKWRLKIEKKKLKNYSSGNGAMFHTELQSMLRFPWKRFKNLKCDGRFTLVNKTNVGLSFCVFLFTLWSKSVNETLFLVRHGLQKFLKIGRKHLRRRIGGAADFVKLGLNNRNHSENCYRLSLNRKQKSCTSYADIKFLVLQVTYGRLYWEKGNARPREENKLKMAENAGNHNRHTRCEWVLMILSVKCSYFEIHIFVKRPYFVPHTISVMRSNSQRFPS